MNTKKIIFSIACIVGILSIMMFVIRDFNLRWVTVDEDKATVIVNFLVPMEQQDMREYIKLENNPVYDSDYSYELEWLNKNSCKITLREESIVKGQLIKLHILDAPTQYAPISKNITIPIQFKAPIEVYVPEEEILISTNQSMIISFNTPINPQKIQSYIKTDGNFIIEPILRTIEKDTQVEDLTTYKFTPNENLENDRNYSILFQKGMPSIGGAILEENQELIIKTDAKPQITSVIPSDGSKWIGLYPRIIVESSTPMTDAYITLDNSTIRGDFKNSYYTIFYPDKPLKPETIYNMEVHIQSATGETSDPKKINFTTVPIKEDKLWIEIITKGDQLMNIYKGETKIQTFICSAGQDEQHTLLGTYYTKDKNENYVGESYGANYCTNLTEGIKIHGLKRNEKWEINPSSYIQLGSYQNSLNVILSEEDARWVFENVPSDTMVIAYPGNN